MTKASITGPGGGEAIDLGPTTMRILEDGSTTGHRLGVGEITVAPHSAAPPQHRHARHDEGFYVVSGTARFTVGAESYEPAGQPGDDPPGAPHTFANRVTSRWSCSTRSPGSVRAVLPGPARHDRRGAALTPEADRERDGRYATEPGHQLRGQPQHRGDPDQVRHGSATSRSPSPSAARAARAAAARRRRAGVGGRLRRPAGRAVPSRCSSRCTRGSADAAPGRSRLRGGPARALPLLAQLGLTGVTVLGSSIGGWIAAELALAAPGSPGWSCWTRSGSGSPSTRWRTTSRSRWTRSRI